MQFNISFVYVNVFCYISNALDGILVIIPSRFVISKYLSIMEEKYFICH